VNNPLQRDNWRGPRLTWPKVSAYFYLTTSKFGLSSTFVTSATSAVFFCYLVWNSQVSELSILF